MLFVGVGALLAASKSRATPAFVPYARPFMHWASHRYQVAWLNPGALRDAFRLNAALGLPEDAATVAGFRTWRHEALLKLRVPWAWVDVMLAPEELAWVKTHGPDRYVQVGPGGVTTAHRDVVCAILG
jgi:hypothetical protein